MPSRKRGPPKASREIDEMAKRFLGSPPKPTIPRPNPIRVKPPEKPRKKKRRYKGKFYGVLEDPTGEAGQ